MDMTRMSGMVGNDASAMQTPQGLAMPANINPLPMGRASMYQQSFAYPGGTPMPAAPGTPSQQQQQQQLLQLRLRQQQLQLQQLQQQQQQQQQQVHQGPLTSPTFTPQPLSAFPQVRMPMPPTSSSPSSSLTRPPDLSPVGKTSSPSNSYRPPFVLPPKVTAPEQIQTWISQCDWTDKSIYVARQLLGGSTVNGFLRATASAQRIKKQRARQVSSASSKTKPDDTEGDSVTMSGSKLSRREHSDQLAEEELKKETMNPRTAKKIRSELQAGVQFCVALHTTIRTILQEIDPKSVLPPPLPMIEEIHRSSSFTQATLPPPPPTPPLVPRVSVETPNSVDSRTSSVTVTSILPIPNPSKSRRTSEKTSIPKAMAPPVPSSSTAHPSSPGDPTGSTLRKLRKRKYTETSTVPMGISEYDDAGKRMFTKKEHGFRIFELLRFRTLHRGDYVAARVSSRDLWILARIVQDYPSLELPPAEFLQLTEAKRDSLFRDKVMLKDVEEKDNGGPQMVTRQMVLPLPRSYSEAAEWGSRLKKGARVYAMYPTTTSLYPATVMDNTTFCRGDDDIIVVEFDEDEKDPNGNLPKWHIPARFVTLIPKEIPSSQATKRNKRNAVLLPASVEKVTKRASLSQKNKQAHKRIKSTESSDSALNDMISEMAYGAFGGGGGAAAVGELDFDNFDFAELGVKPTGQGQQPPLNDANLPVAPTVQPAAYTLHNPLQRYGI